MMTAPLNIPNEYGKVRQKRVHKYFWTRTRL